MENIARGQRTKESEETNSDPLAVVQLRDGSDLAKTGSMNLETSAWVHMTFLEREETSLADALKAVGKQT